MVRVPAEHRGRFITVDGIGIHCREEGNGPPVVCLHGNPTWSYYFRHLIAALKPNHRVIAPDHVGCGLSDKPSLKRYPYSLSRRVDDFDAVVRATLPQGKFSLVVHDWGGMIGFAWAVKNADRIDKLVVMNSAAFPLPAGKKLPMALRLGRWPLMGSLLVRRLNFFCLGAARHCVTRQAMPADVQQMYLAPYERARDRVAVEQFVRTIPVHPDDIGYDIAAATAAGLKNLRDKPMLLAWGLRDFVFDGDYLQEWRRHFPAAQVRAIADAGHYVLEDAGAELIPAITRFLGP